MKDIFVYFPFMNAVLVKIFKYFSTKAINFKGNCFSIK